MKQPTPPVIETTQPANQSIKPTRLFRGGSAPSYYVVYSWLLPLLPSPSPSGGVPDTRFGLGPPQVRRSAAVGSTGLAGGGHGIPHNPGCNWCAKTSDSRAPAYHTSKGP
jgi:hypothetical protein